MGSRRAGRWELLIFPFCRISMKKMIDFGRCDFIPVSVLKRQHKHPSSCLLPAPGSVPGPRAIPSRGSLPSPQPPLPQGWGDTASHPSSVPMQGYGMPRRNACSSTSKTFVPGVVSMFWGCPASSRGRGGVGRLL